ncbi:MAG: phosphoadenylyl-sulfate reductase [Marinilabiliales bacterium]|nr:MAG: phosphoadenylyl-sulfate reductase [Marinilabiliales bacterium]
MDIKKEINEWNDQLESATAEEIILFFTSKFKDKIALSTSLGLEDQALTEIVCKINKDTEIFTLDTGRLFPETYDLIDLTSKKYKKEIKVFFPDSEEIEEMVATKGINLFYDSIESRKLCCGLRKIKPLKRALKGLDAWITGLRREQSVTRTDLNIVEWDEANEMIKVNPLINWTETDVWNYISKHNIPFNTLHKKGFASIGCQPCTRAITEGEDVRAGRWWWENPETKECGLHIK